MLQAVHLIIESPLDGGVFEGGLREETNLNRSLVEGSRAEPIICSFYSTLAIRRHFDPILLTRTLRLKEVKQHLTQGPAGHE